MQHASGLLTLIGAAVGVLGGLVLLVGVVVTTLLGAVDPMPEPAEVRATPPARRAA